MPGAVRARLSSSAFACRSGKATVSRRCKRANAWQRLATRCCAQPGDPLSKRIHNTDKKAKAIAVVNHAALTPRLMQKETVKPHTRGDNFIYYLGGAVLCGGAIYGFMGFQAAQEYFAAYLLEQSLGVDNLFVFMLCFSFFRTPQELQDRVLMIGVWSAAVLRLVMILAGVQLVENFKPVLLVFAAILLYSSFGLLFGEDDDSDEDLSDNFIVKTINKVFTVTPDYRADKFFVQEDNIWKVTPLFVVLAVIEISDVIFAVDSIPAVFGVTLDPVVVYTSNMAAILSLRALYGFVATVIADLRYLDKAVAVILAFIGGKIILDEVPGGYHVSTEQSLLFVATALGVGVATSLLLPDEAAAEESKSENGSLPASVEAPVKEGKKDTV